jgi:hypothetical protein
LLAVTTPFVTVAIELSLVLQTTTWSVAFAGKTVADKVSLVPEKIAIEEIFKTTPVTSTGDMVTTHVPERPPAAAVIVTLPALPVLFAVTIPFVTVANVLSLVLHVTSLLVAFDGETAAVRVVLAPDARVAVLRSKSTEVTAIGDMVTTHELV